MRFSPRAWGCFLAIATDTTADFAVAYTKWMSFAAVEHCVFSSQVESGSLKSMRTGMLRNFWLVAVFIKYERELA